MIIWTRMLFFIVFIFLCLFACQDQTKTPYWQKASLEKDHLYLVFRGTDSKEGFLARDFNIRDSLSSHVGFLVYERNDWYVYHVLDFKDNKSDLRKHGSSQFFNPKNETINYASVWELSHIDSSTLNQINKRIRYYESMIIEFDRSFSLRDSTKLYCSEFIYKVLKYADPNGFSLEPRTIKLSGVYNKYFRKDSLEYIPVDAFQYMKHVQLIDEWKFK